MQTPALHRHTLHCRPHWKLSRVGGRGGGGGGGGGRGGGGGGRKRKEVEEKSRQLKEW